MAENSVWDDVDTEPVTAEFYPLGEHEDGDTFVLKFLSKFRPAEQSKHAPVEAEVEDPTMGDEYLLAPTSKHLLSDLQDIDPDAGDRVRFHLEQTGEGSMNRVWSAEEV